MPTSRLAAIMFTDIVGYTAMMQSNRDSAMSAVKDFEAVLKDRIASHSGELLQTYGDGSLSIFDSASAAVSCAKEIQEAIRGKVPLRIGIHMGEITIDGEHTFGDGVNIASRIESIGTAGAVLMSSSIRQQIKNKPEFQLESLGNFSFKNVAEPMPIYGLANERFVLPKAEEISGKGKRLAENGNQDNRNLIRGILVGFVGIIIAGGIWMNISWKGSEEVQPDTTATPSIAVMPFLDLSPKQDQAFLGDGMAEEVINLLSQESELKVSSRSSSFSFKKQEVDLFTIADKLGVDHILEGSVKEYGGKIKISVQLIEAEIDKTIWAESWEEQLEDVFDIQENIAREVMQALKINLIEAQKWQVEETEADAYRLFLQAKHEFNTESNARKARELVLRSIERDSLYAASWILLGQIDGNFASRGGSPTGIRDYQDLYDLAIKHARKGVELGPKLAYGYANLALIYSGMFGKKDSALFYAEKAMELGPGDAQALGVAGMTKCKNSQFKEGLPLLDRAARLDPLSWTSFAAKGIGNATAHRFDIAEASFRTWIRLQPNTGGVHYQLAQCLIQQGRLEEAEVLASKERLGGYRKCAQSIVAWKKGDQQAADSYLAELIERFSSSSSYQIAQVYAHRQDADKAFEWLEKSYENHDPGTLYAPVDVAFHSIQADPRWEPFVEKVSK
ncbi:MAG: adenylate/guanylate cyclase domain-containing protein [Bacteroidia bacterium]|nr:adenylate/guanylate cyclase domain-containing protein [Bacteroidia bacterium]